MNVEQIRELIGIVEKSNITSFEMEESGYRIRIGKEEAICGESGHALHETAKRPPLEEDRTVRDFAGRKTEQHVLPEHTQEGTAIKSPMLGVFYSSPAPDSPPFVKTGDRIRKGDVLCIIEAMKLMNEIIAENDGEIVETGLENGQIVEYGQTLFRVKPLPGPETATENSRGKTE